MNERTFRPSESHKLEDPERLKFLPSAEVLARLDLRPGLEVADIGAGTGYFAIPIAHAVAPGGKVSAVDMQSEMLDRFRVKLASMAGAPENIELVEGEATRTGLAGRAFDRVLIANVWHELDDRAAALREAARILRLDGVLAVLDWRPGVDRPPGPPLEHRIPPHQVIRTLESNGWRVRESANVGQYSYIIVASR